MKRLIIIALALFSVFTVKTVEAQKIAFVDVQYILKNMAEYETAQQELNRFSTKWQKEIEGRYEQIKKLKDAFQAESILLTPDMKRQRQDDIRKKEKEALDLQTKRFGVKGDLFQKRQELIQPVQDQIHEAVKEVAGSSYMAVFDISGQNNLLFANEKYDKTDAVMKKLGIRPGEGGSNKKDESKPNEGGSTPSRGTPNGGQTTPQGGNRR